MDLPVDKSPDGGGEPEVQVEWPSRPQRRLLRRLYNGRTVPIRIGALEFLTYKAALAHLLTLDLAEREACYEQMKAAAKSGSAD
jgi:hypothetical protein